MARYYWFDEFKNIAESERIITVSEMLAAFYQAAVIDKAPMGLSAKELEKREKALERYKKPDYEFSSRGYTSYSIIADAVNDGPLNGECSDVLLRKGELVYLLKLAAEVNPRISEKIVCRLAALIVYYRRYAEKYKVKDGSIPVSNWQMNNWLGSKYLQKGKGGQLIWASEYRFIKLEGRESIRDGSSFLMVDMVKLETNVKEMISSFGLSKKDEKKFESTGWEFKDNELTEAIDEIIKKYIKDPRMEEFFKTGRLEDAKAFAQNVLAVS